MSKQPKKKKLTSSIRDIKDNNVINSNINIPPAEAIYNKFLNESNIIVNEILEKIISLVISSNFNNNIEKQISSSCFNFIKDTIDSYISSAFISHDKDETYHESFAHIKDELIPEIEPISIKNETSNLDINNNILFSQSNLKLEEEVYFNNFYHGENDWDLMDEPISNKFDRYATTMIKTKEIEKDKNINLKYKKNGEVLEEIDEESEKNSVKNGKKIDKANSKIKRKENTKTKSKENVNNNETNGNIVMKKRNLIDIMNQFSYHDLDNNDDIYVEPNEMSFEKLRKEIQEKQKEEIQEKTIQNKAKIEMDNKMRIEAEKNKKLIGKKITVDANGQIVFIKSIKIDKLKNEFTALKTATKLVKDEEKEKKKKKKKINQDENGQEQAQDEKNGENNNNNIKEEIVEKNNNMEKTKKPKGKKLPKLKNKKLLSNLKEMEDDPLKARILKRIEEGPILPSGSNFDIINLEVGVSLKENEKYKTGGKDFYHKYNKYSMDNYNKKLKDTNEVNSFLKTYEEVANPTKSDYNYLGNFTETYNSSVGFVNKSIFNQQKTNILTKYNTLSNFGINSNKSLMKTNSNFIPNLKLSRGGSSLMGSMEKLNLISEREEKLAKKTENLFKKNSSKFSSTSGFILPKFEEINKFTSEILTSTNWMQKNGVKNTIGAPFRKPEKPGLKEITREMGVKGKSLRNRAKNISQEQIGIMSLEAVDFFKQ